MPENIENVKSRLEEDVYQQLWDGVGVAELEMPPVESELAAVTDDDELRAEEGATDGSN